MKTYFGCGLTTNEKMIQDVKTQNGDDMQSIAVLYMTQLEALSQHHCFMKGGGGALSPKPPHVYAEVLRHSSL